MHADPVRLRVCERCVERSDGRCDPEVERRPAVGEELGWSGERQGVGLEEVEQVRDEEACVGGDLYRSVSDKT